MNTREVTTALGTLFAELVDGAPASGGYMLNPGDRGLLRTLDTLSAAGASTRTATGSSLTAHVDHVRYGLSLMNRWSAGENPFGDADWGASWTKTTVTDEEWRGRITLALSARSIHRCEDQLRGIRRAVWLQCRTCPAPACYVRYAIAPAPDAAVSRTNVRKSSNASMRWPSVSSS